MKQNTGALMTFEQVSIYNLMWDGQIDKNILS